MNSVKYSIFFLPLLPSQKQEFAQKAKENPSTQSKQALLSEPLALGKPTPIRRKSDPWAK
jgi:hypothetical protein